MKSFLFTVGSVALLLSACPTPSRAQVAYSGPAGATLLQKARKLQAAGDRAGAAAAYQQAYAAYTSADDSDGMTAALAGRKTTEADAGTLRPARAASPKIRATGTAPRAATAAAPATRPAPLVKSTPPGPAPLPGSTAGGRPVGLFLNMTGSNRQYVYYFTPAGQVYVDPANFSAAALQAVPPDWRGTYSTAGKEITIKWAGGQAETHAFRHDPTGFGWSGNSFVCVGPFVNPRQLVGTFEGSNSALGLDANSLTLASTLCFQPDGTFTRASLADSHSQTNQDHATSKSAGGYTTDASAASQQAGRWSLSGWWLTLTDARGTVRGLAFPSYTVDGTKAGKAASFRFNGTTYRNTAAR